MKKLYATAAVALVIIIAGFLLVLRSSEEQDRLHYEHGETELVVSNTSGAAVELFKAGRNLREVEPMPPLQDERIWLPAGNYFLKVEHSGKNLFYPVPLVGYRAGPDKDGAFTVTIRSPHVSVPQALFPNLPDFVFIPSGHFLFGDRLRVQEPHYVWLRGFFINPFEVTNEEFREFLRDIRGYSEDTNWTEAGRKWKAANTSHSTALMTPSDPDFKRFGQPDQPVVKVNWFEANAYCNWLTRKVGPGKWIFGLPTEAEWEKAARGPDNFDYSLSMHISDEEVSLYNWTKNPGAAVTVIGIDESKAKYQANRYGLYHITGNVTEWTQSVYRSYSRQHPYMDDDDRNHDDVPGERVLRGGSWYTASIAVLNISYRENFRPEVQTPYLGFRVVARPIP